MVHGFNIRCILIYKTWGDMCPADLALLGNFKVKEGKTTQLVPLVVAQSGLICVPLTFPRDTM